MSLSSKLLYELNPPKLLSENVFSIIDLDKQIKRFIARASALVQLVRGLHITDSVLGIPRVSSVVAASILKDAGIKLELGCSLRISDRNLIAVLQFLSEAIKHSVESILIVRGDSPFSGPSFSRPTATEVLKVLSFYGIDTHLKLYLSFPSKISNSVIQTTKLNIKPYGFITQSISSLSDLGQIIDLVRPQGIRVIPCIMCPSEKNVSSASKIGLDWSEYLKDPVQFIAEAAKISDKVIISSPNSFDDGLKLLNTLNENSL